jgi:hypothetical protein
MTLLSCGSSIAYSANSLTFSMAIDVRLWVRGDDVKGL